MKKTFIILAFLTSFLFGLKVISASEPISKNGHSIRKLSLTTVPESIEANENFDLTLKFVLRSKTGISKTRIKLFINNGTQSIDDITLSPNTDSDNENENLEVYDVTLTKKDFSLSKANNEIKIQYLLSSITPSSILAQATISKNNLKGGSSNNNGNGSNGGGNGNTDNGDDGVTVAPRLVSLFAESVDFTENANGTVMNEPVVSTNEQFFRLTVDHDQRLLDVVNGDTFNAATNPVLKNLKIYRIDPNNKKDKVEISNGFDFSLEEESTKITSNATTKNGQPLLETVYLSNGKVLKERQNLQFVIDLDNFYARSGVVLESNLITSDRDTIKIKAQEAEVTNLSLSEPITFNVSNSSKKNLTYTSNTVNLSGTYFSENGSPSTIDSIDFFLTKKGKKKTPKILAKKNHNLTLKVFDSNGSSTVNSSSFTVPVSFSVTGSNSQFKSGGFYSIPAKNFTIPFSITAKTTDDLDFILKGTLDESYDAVFNAPVVVNGSSL